MIYNHELVAIPNDYFMEIYVMPNFAVAQE